MTGTAPLSTFAQITLDGSGNGQIEIGPTGFGEVWTQVIASVHCSSNTNEATCRVYTGGAPTSQFFNDGTTWGSTGDATSNLPPTVVGGQQIWAVWSGGDPGATAYLTLSGIRLVAGRTPDTDALIMSASGGSFAHDIAGGNGNLIATSFQSPNYVPGVSGWAVFKNGDAEFNDGTFRGFIVDGGMFLYSGAPGLGNPPVAWATPPGVAVDPYGNALPGSDGGYAVQGMAAVDVYEGIAKAQLHVNSTVGAPALEMFTGVASEKLKASIYNFPVNVGDPNEFENLVIQGPESTHDSNSVKLSLTDSAADGSAIATGFLSYNATTIAYWDSVGFHILTTLWGVSGVLTIGDQIARSATGFSGYPEYSLTGNPDGIANNNIVPANISSIWAVPANDGQSGTRYTIEGFGYGELESEILNLRLVGYGGTQLIAISIGASAFNVGQSIAFDFKAVVQVNSTGATGKVAASISGNISITGAPVTGLSAAQNSFGFNNNVAGSLVTVDTTSPSLFAVQAWFGAAAAGQFVECTYDTFERRGL